MHEMITQLPVDRNSTDDYCMTDRFAQKSSSASGSSNFKPKVEKCSTLRFGGSKSHGRFIAGDGHRPLSNSIELRSSKISGNTSSRTRFIPKPK